MECERCNLKLSAFCDGELGAVDSERIRGHLETCRRCAEDLAELKALRGLLRALPQPDPRPDFWADTHRRIRLRAAESGRTVRASSQVHVGWALAGAAVFFVAVLAAPRRIDQTPESPPTIHVAALVSLHANLRADSPLEDCGLLRYSAGEATALELADDHHLDVD